MAAGLRRAVAGAFLFVLLLPGAATAREVTDDERALLAATVERFKEALLGSDYGTVFDILPPRILPVFAEQAGLSVAQIRDELTTAMVEVMAMVTTFGFEVEFGGTRYLELADGSPYALIPSETFVGIGDMAIRAESETLAVLEDGAWYLVRVDEMQQVEILRSVYPLFADVEFNEPVVETIGP